MRPTTTTSGRLLGTRPAGNPVASVVPGTAKIMDFGHSFVAANAWAEANAVATRALLSARFTDLGVAVTWVGPYTGGGIAHAGVSGSTIVAQTAAVGAWLTTYEPDVVVILTGHNDGGPAATLTSRYSTLLSTMYAARASCRVVPCLLPITAASAHGPLFAEAAPLLTAAWAASDYATAGRLRAADLRGCIPTRSGRDTAVADGIHPTPRSYQRMASALWPTLLNALGRSADW